MIRTILKKKMMNFEVGDKVLVMDENFSGVVSNILPDKITIETEEGFELDFSPNELLKINPKESINKELFSNQSIKTVISEKEEEKRRKNLRVKPKEGNQPTMEVDLHIHQLTSNERGMSGHDKLTLQLDTAKRKLEFAMSKNIQKIVLIHGVGQGVLRAELEFMVNRYDNMKWYDANYQKYGLGAMEVYIYQNAKS
ncbi:DNA mismatch repair protein MutS [Subsaxibacter sp. CAU 1640]|uniref:DNA mismatch repair protein MutS n=1 Tax=Subsaxibacter sp. CAU 1640 TaxID=2933271 RepID=UPI002003D479|nr:DNA mismatch repair protein MutS [Subsaxibacter sp. CAU 1640]MCK7590446.1 DNA mismatch repair protein MutS [Subsaxibacter sp. CAU 1640]